MIFILTKSDNWRNLNLHLRCPECPHCHVLLLFSFISRKRYLIGEEPNHIFLFFRNSGITKVMAIENFAKVDRVGGRLIGTGCLDEYGTGIIQYEINLLCMCFKIPFIILMCAENIDFDLQLK